jgi:hypothetical protein
LKGGLTINEDTIKVILTYDGDAPKFLALTPDQLKLLNYLREEEYLTFNLDVNVDPDFEKI